MRHRDKGFTLTQLLIVIVILALLTAILLPVFFQARAKSQATICTSNLRSLWQAVRMYVDDHDGVWPDTQDWIQWDPPGKTSPGCPLTVLSPEALQREKFLLLHPHSVVGYAYNAQLGARTNPEANPILHPEVDPNDPNLIPFFPTTDKDIPYPSTTVAFVDAEYASKITIAPNPNTYLSPYPYEAEKGWKRHNGGANYAFCDGHVRWHRPEDVVPALIVNKDRTSVVHYNDGVRPTFARMSAPSEKQP